MPHAESDMSTTVTNGDKTSFQTLGHIKSYPVVSDSIDAVKSHPYGAKSFEFADAAYDRFGKPIEPYLKGPYAYAKPYVEKADSLGDKGLGKLDSTFPIVKEDTQTLVSTAKSYAFYPLEFAGKGRDYLYSTWNDEYSKTASRNDRGDGLLTLAFAGVSTVLKIQQDALNTVSDYLGPKKDAAKAKKDVYVDGAKKKKNSYSDDAKGLLDSYTKKAQATADDVSAKAQDKTSS
ncbi:hypothetical protein AAFC00_001683 [Neodothiora populina]|uniref:Pathogenesis associated protein Cap20 n=1 Tax=Neodothiora populina TaxID=2781224 RepID=A0ABR3PPT1_9PEZI